MADALPILLSGATCLAMCGGKRAVCAPQNAVQINIMKLAGISFLLILRFAVVAFKDASPKIKEMSDIPQALPAVPRAVRAIFTLMCRETVYRMRYAAIVFSSRLCRSKDTGPD